MDKSPFSGKVSDMVEWFFKGVIVLILFGTYSTRTFVSCAHAPTHNRPHSCITGLGPSLFSHEV